MGCTSAIVYFTPWIPEKSFAMEQSYYTSREPRNLNRRLVLSNMCLIHEQVMNTLVGGMNAHLGGITRFIFADVSLVSLFRNTFRMTS